MTAVADAFLGLIVVLGAMQMMYGQSTGTLYMPVSQFVPKLILTAILIHLSFLMGQDLLVLNNLLCGLVHANVTVCWLLGTSVQKIGMFYMMEQAFLPKHMGYEYNQYSLFCVYAPTTCRFSRRRGSITAVCIFLDQATRLFPLARVPRTCFVVDQTTDKLPFARHLRRSIPRQSRTAGGKRIVATSTDHLAATGETPHLSEERSASPGAIGQDSSNLETGPLSCSTADTSAASIVSSSACSGSAHRKPKRESRGSRLRRSA
jgi:hypothetical protein